MRKMTPRPEPPPVIKLPDSKNMELTDDADNDSSTHEPQTIEVTKSLGRSQCSHEETPRDTNASHRDAIPDADYEAISMVYFRGKPFWTEAAMDKSRGASSYDQVSMRDFISSALAFLMKGEHLTVKNVWRKIAYLRSMEKMVDLFKRCQPAYFKVHCCPTKKTESLQVDLDGTAIGRIASVDPVSWFNILLSAYTKWTGENSLAQSPNWQRAMRLILRLSLSKELDTLPTLYSADDCFMMLHRMIVLRDFIPIASAFLEKTEHLIVRSFHDLMPKTLLVDFVETAFGRFAAADFRFWWIVLLATYTKWSWDNCPWIMNSIPDLCFSEGYNTSPDLFFATVLSLTDPRKMIPAYNRVTVSLDESEDGNEYKSLASYQRGIGAIRAYCRANVTPIDVSSLYGSNLEIFTTPASGTIYITIDYRRRSITILLAGRDLYVKGWRGGKYGDFELRLATGHKYMLGENVICLDLKSNYYFLSPGGLVGETRMGPGPMREAFEVLYRCRGERSRSVCQAIAIYAVHFSEAARTQCAYRAACAAFMGFYMPTLDFESKTLDSQTKNSFWIKNYDYYCSVGMRQVEELLSGRIPSAIENKEGADIKSAKEIFSEIRILLRDAFGQGRFKHEAMPPSQTESPEDWLRGGDGSSTFPEYLLEEWIPIIKQEEKEPEQIVQEGKQHEKMDDDGEPEEKGETENIKQEEEQEGHQGTELKGHGEAQISSTSSFTGVTAFRDMDSITGDFCHFPVVRMFKEQLQRPLSLNSVDRTFVPILKAPVAGIGVRTELVALPWRLFGRPQPQPVMRSVFKPWRLFGRPQPQPVMRSVFNAGVFLSRYLRYAL